jgi:hypothetical protein
LQKPDQTIPRDAPARADGVTGGEAVKFEAAILAQVREVIPAAIQNRAGFILGKTWFVRDAWEIRDCGFPCVGLRINLHPNDYLLAWLRGHCDYLPFHETLPFKNSTTLARLIRQFGRQPLQATLAAIRLPSSIKCRT